MWLTVVLVIVALIVVSQVRRLRSEKTKPPNEGGWMGMDFGVGALWLRLIGRE